MGARGETWQAEVLEILTRRAEPLSAYEVLGELSKVREKAVPPTVYRALSALQERGRVHRLESLNAYIACSCSDHTAAAILSICDDCGSVQESIEPDIVSDLTVALGKSGFAAQRHVIEVHGLCATCNESGAQI